MDRLAYFRDLVDCPECGLPTNYLHQLTENKQKVLRCSNCVEEEKEE